MRYFRITLDAAARALHAFLRRTQRRPYAKGSAFPLHELYISAFVIALILVGAYFALGAWSGVLAWSVGAFLCMSLAGLPFASLFEAAGCLRERKFVHAAGYLLAAVVAGAIWIGAVGYCAYRAYRAVP